MKGRKKAPLPPIRRTSVPAFWFEGPLRNRMRKLIAPPTHLTRRRLLELKLPLPRELFEPYMEPLLDGDAHGLEREEDGTIKPTKETATSQRFDYTITRPMVTDRLFALEKSDLRNVPRPKPGKGAWRRCMGGARLNLARDGHKKGKLGASVSMPAGNTVIEYRVPKRENAMPLLTLRCFSVTMNHHGNIQWPAKFTEKSRALLRKLLRQKVEQMIADPEYPTDPRLAGALTRSSDTFLRLRAEPTPPAGSTRPNKEQALLLGGPTTEGTAPH
jgi:hypothetical protein